MKCDTIISDGSKTTGYPQNINIGLLVTSYQNKKLPVYDWYSYKHSFSRDLVIELISKFHLHSADKILDPFCGSGTTLLASKEMGISATGVDILPFSVFISNAKLFRYNEEHIIKAINEINDILTNHRKKDISSTKKELLLDFFPEDILDKVLLVEEWINSKADKQIKYFFLTGLFSVLSEVSYTRKDGGFLRILKEKKIQNFEYIYLSKLYKMLQNLDFVNKLPSTTVKAIKGDARLLTLNSNSISAIITSPPYPNRHDYTRVYLLELIIGFIDNEKEIKSLRYNSIRSHVEAKSRFTPYEYNMPRRLNNILEELSKKQLPNRQVIKMLQHRFSNALKSS